MTNGKSPLPAESRTETASHVFARGDSLGFGQPRGIRTESLSVSPLPVNARTKAAGRAGLEFVSSLLIPGIPVSLGKIHGRRYIERLS